MKPERLPLIRTKGGPRERGRQQGEQARLLIRSALDRYRRAIPQATGLTWEAALRAVQTFLPHGQSAFPQFVEEIRGVAEGAGIPFAETWLLNCYEELLDVQERAGGCTSLAVRGDRTADGHVLLAHNEDWFSIDLDTVYLIHGEPDDGPAFLGMTYGPLLPNIGLNEEGIGVAIDAVSAGDGRVGVPRILFSRAVLSARTIGQAIGSCVPDWRAGGYSYLLGDSHGELYSIETSATAHDVLYGHRGWLAHTNHYLSPKMQALEEPGSHHNSLVRFNRALRLLRAQAGAVTVEGLQGILRDHVNFPDSVCGHEDAGHPPHEREMTIVSLVMDLSEGVMWAAPGPPCEGEYSAYDL
jgi:isopenicillin-N N-acyltransferase-like protein